MGHTDQETTLALLIVTLALVVIAALCCIFKDFYACVTCPFRCIGTTYKRCCSAPTSYSVQNA